jgi:hypothetical protein
VQQYDIQAIGVVDPKQSTKWHTEERRCLVSTTNCLGSFGSLILGFFPELGQPINQSFPDQVSELDGALLSEQQMNNATSLVFPPA